MPYIKPWSKETEDILKRLSKNSRAWTYNSTIGREFGKRYRYVLDREYLDIATTRYSRRRDKTLFQLDDNWELQPKHTNLGLHFHFRRK